jgi:hypothetical protein
MRMSTLYMSKALTVWHQYVSLITAFASVSLERIEVLLADCDISGFRFETTLADSHVWPGALPVLCFIYDPLP